MSLGPLQLEAMTQDFLPFLHEVDCRIASEVMGQLETLDKVAHHMLESGGKRLRPLLVFLVARALGHQVSREHLVWSSIIELIHMATLLHDDVVDTSEQRRGKKTANALWGNPTSVLTGDYFYSKAFQWMIELQSMDLIELLANTTNRIAYGEVFQLECAHQAELSKEDYFRLIECKTALLFATSSEGSARLIDPEAAEAMRTYGLALGMVFQIMDDRLDYHRASSKLGKNIGDDLANGKMTLPMILLLEGLETEERLILRTAIERGDREQLPWIQKKMLESGVDEKIKTYAQYYANQGLEALNPIAHGEPRQRLEQAMFFALQRDF